MGVVSGCPVLFLVIHELLYHESHFMMLGLLRKCIVSMIVKISDEKRELISNHFGKKM